MTRHRLRAAGSWLALAAVFLAVRLPYFAVAAEPRELYENERTAVCIVERGFLGDPYPGHGGPSAHSAPAYPVLLAGVYAVTDDGPVRRLIQAGLCTLATAVGIALLPAVGRAVVGSAAAGWVAAFALAGLPFETRVQVVGQFESAYLLPATGAFLLAARRTQAAGWRVGPAAGLGALTGGLALLSPGYLPALALAATADLAVGPNRRRVLVGGLVAGLVAAAVVAPWAARNGVALGGFCPVRSNLGLELDLGNNDQADGTALRVSALSNPRHVRAPFRNPPEVARLREVGELAYMADRQREAVGWIAAHPGRFAELTARRVWLFWFPAEHVWYPTGESPGYRLLRTLAYWGSSALAAVGLARLWRRDRRAAGLATAVLVGLTLPYYLTVVDPRHTLQVRGLVLVLAADALLTLRRPASPPPPEAA